MEGWRDVTDELTTGKWPNVDDVPQVGTWFRVTAGERAIIYRVAGRCKVGREYTARLHRESGPARYDNIWLNELAYRVNAWRGNVKVEAREDTDA